jgi:hypothetical protein
LCGDAGNGALHVTVRVTCESRDCVEGECCCEEERDGAGRSGKS